MVAKRNWLKRSTPHTIPGVGPSSASNAEPQKFCKKAKSKRQPDDNPRAPHVTASKQL
jgi:hypothetical protein